MILYFLCFARLPFQNVNDLDQLRDEIVMLRNSGISIPNTRSDFPNELSTILRLLLSTNPNDRPSAGSIVKTFSHMRTYRHVSQNRTRNHVALKTLPAPTLQVPMEAALDPSFLHFVPPMTRAALFCLKLYMTRALLADGQFTGPLMLLLSLDTLK
jgi:serine/threonine protein kinase